MNFGVIGDGSWGTAIALLLVKEGHRVCLWGAFPEHIEQMRQSRENKKFLPGRPLPKELELSSDISALAAQSEILISVVPTVYLRSVMEKLKPHYKKGTPIVSATKGMELKTLQLPHQMIRSVLGDAIPIAVLSGPSHAEEVARGLPASVVVASEDEVLAQKIQNEMGSERFRIYSGKDPVGVEIAAALKNIIALAGGICDGLQLGDNAKAAMVTRGIVEMARYGVARGAKQETFSGLAGIGDLLTTCYSMHSRNRAVGERLAQGETIEEIQSSMVMVAEGVTTAKALIESNPPVEMPICQEVYEILFKGKSPHHAMVDLMQLTPKEEAE